MVMQISFLADVRVNMADWAAGENGKPGAFSSRDVSYLP